MSKRDAICDSALELFAEKGIEATTTRGIAARGDAVEGTLHRHVEGKTDQAGELSKCCSNVLQERLAEALTWARPVRRHARTRLSALFLRSPPPRQRRACLSFQPRRRAS